MTALQIAHDTLALAALHAEVDRLSNGLSALTFAVALVLLIAVINRRQR